jgi:hypothetical protein
MTDKDEGLLLLADLPKEEERNRQKVSRRHHRSGEGTGHRLMLAFG